MVDIVLHDLEIDSETHAGWSARTQTRVDPVFTSFALGLAQHYGLPSVGLDLTTELLIAAWFACCKIRIDDGQMTVELIETGSDWQRNVFIFRCPSNAVFDHANVKPDSWPAGRPEGQSAWFAHVGWGEARNQAANYLACAFRLTDRFVEQHGNTLLSMTERMFPPARHDPVLSILLKMRQKEKYEGAAKEILSRIYQ